MGTLTIKALRGSALVAILVLAGTPSWPATAWADAAPLWQPGDAIGEPTGAVAHVAITHEDLAFDLRPLVDAKPVTVSATYQLRNDSAAASAPLVFLADHALTGASDFTVSFDGSPLPATSTTLTRLPDVWKPPTVTPSLSNGEALQYVSRPGSAFAFTAVIPPGSHRLAVTYAAMPGNSGAPNTTIVWQIGYVLAPARQWASFGDLSIRATLPSGWRARATPELARVGSSLVGQFSGLPADSLAISAAFPEEPHARSVPAWLGTQWPLAAILLLVTAIAGVAAGILTAHRWPFALSGLMWAVPAAWQWFSTAYVTPPQGQFDGAGKCGCVTIGCALLPGALLVAVVAAGMGALAVVIPMFLAAAVWARLRRTA